MLDGIGPMHCLFSWGDYCRPSPKNDQTLGPFGVCEAFFSHNRTIAVAVVVGSLVRDCCWVDGPDIWTERRNSKEKETKSKLNDSQEQRWETVDEKKRIYGIRFELPVGVWVPQPLLGHWMLQGGALLRHKGNIIFCRDCHGISLHPLNVPLPVLFQAQIHYRYFRHTPGAKPFPTIK